MTGRFDCASMSMAFSMSWGAAWGFAVFRYPAVL